MDAQKTSVYQEIHTAELLPFRSLLWGFTQFFNCCFDLNIVPLTLVDFCDRSDMETGGLTVEAIQRVREESSRVPDGASSGPGVLHFCCQPAGALSER